MDIQRFIVLFKHLLPEELFNKILSCTLVRCQELTHHDKFKDLLLRIVSDTNKKYLVYLREDYEGNLLNSILVFTVQGYCGVSKPISFGDKPTKMEILMLSQEASRILSADALE